MTVLWGQGFSLPLKRQVLISLGGCSDGVIND